MILPDFVLESRIHKRWKESGLDSRRYCYDKLHFDNFKFPVEYSYSSRGFRDSEWPNDINDLQESIWCVGDSFTVGLGNPVEHTWPNLLSRRLDRRCINVSMDGASNNWICRKVCRILTDIKPSHIIIQWSYLHRSETDVIKDSDEMRRLYAMDNLSTEYQFDNFTHLLKKVENAKGNCKIIHSFIPLFFPTVTQLLWTQFRGPSWPISAPVTHAAVTALPSFVINELKDFGYDLLESHQCLLKLYESMNSDNINYIPEITTIDFARDGHHYGIKTAEKFVDDVMKLI